MQIKDHEEQFETPIELSDDQNLFVFVGGNNSGKSTLLRSINKTSPKESYIVNVNRTVLDGEGALDKNYQRNVPNYMNEFTNTKDDNWRKPFKHSKIFSI